jgi:four helix bundle protein
MQNDKSKFKKEFIRRLMVFSVNLVKFCSKLRQKRDYWVIADQLLDSGTSIGSNSVEAKASSSRREYIKFFEIALKSANETLYWLIIVKESVLELKTESEKLYNECEELTKILCSSVLTLKGKK